MSIPNEVSSALYVFLVFFIFCRATSSSISLDVLFWYLFVLEKHDRGFLCNATRYWDNEMKADEVCNVTLLNLVMKDRKNMSLI